eukprot:1930638-Pleurochrysis_carterae.AAC.2
MPGHKKGVAEQMILLSVTRTRSGHRRSMDAWAIAETAARPKYYSIYRLYAILVCHGAALIVIWRPSSPLPTALTVGSAAKLPLKHAEGLAGSHA